jgi:hypothetical protein
MRISGFFVLMMRSIIAGGDVSLLALPACASGAQKRTLSPAPVLPGSQEELALPHGLTGTIDADTDFGVG